MRNPISRLDYVCISLRRRVTIAVQLMKTAAAGQNATHQIKWVCCQTVLITPIILDRMAPASDLQRSPRIRWRYGCISSISSDCIATQTTISSFLQQAAKRKIFRRFCLQQKRPIPRTADSYQYKQPCFPKHHV